MLPEVKLSPRHRCAVLDALTPYAIKPDAAERVLAAVEHCAAIYLRDAGERVTPTRAELREVVAELGKLRETAEAFEAGLDGLSENARELLFAWVEHAPPPDEPGKRGQWAPLVPRETFYRARRDAGFLAARAAMLAADLAAERLPGGKPPNRAAFVFVSLLADAWQDATGRPLPRTGNPARSPWGRFVEACCAAAGVEAEPDYFARVVAESRSARRRKLHRD
jgi:hypothetical protein